MPSNARKIISFQREAISGMCQMYRNIHRLLHITTFPFWNNTSFFLITDIVGYTLSFRFHYTNNGIERKQQYITVYYWIFIWSRTSRTSCYNWTIASPNSNKLLNGCRLFNYNGGFIINSVKIVDNAIDDSNLVMLYPWTLY